MSRATRTPIVLCYIFSFITVFNSSQAECILKYEDFPEKEPVLLHSDYSLITPQSNAITLRQNQEIRIACFGPGNIINAIRFNMTSAQCTQNNKLQIGNVKYLLSELECIRAVSGDVQVTNVVCGDKKGVVKNIGHKISNNKFDVLIKICYNNNTGEAIYAEHILYGSAIKFAKKVSTRPGFKRTGLGPGISADLSFKKITQKATFTQILGSAKEAEKYINGTSFLARGHLSPDGDAIYVSSQYITYFYINVLPQWQNINNGNWKSLERAVRNVAGNIEQDIKIITGGYQTLTLADKDGIQREIYLGQKQKLPVPKFMWKVVYSIRNRKAIAFVIVNDPFFEHATNKHYLCEDICEKEGWGVPGWNNTAKGLLYCCDVKQLKKVIHSIPDLIITGVLQARDSNTWFSRFFM